MNKNVFFIEFSVEFWLDVAEALRERQGWQPVYWTGVYSLEEKVRRRFPDACFHANFDAVKSIPVAEYASMSLPPLGADLLGQLAECERTALRMMERMDPDESLTYTDRVRLFHRHVRYWLGMLEFYRPDVVLFPTTPHLMYDYVLYSLCKLKNIQTVLFSEASVDGYIYSIDGFENSSRELVEKYHQLASTRSEAVLSEKTEAYLQKVRSDYAQGQPSYLKHVLEQQVEVPAEVEDEPAEKPPGWWQRTWDYFFKPATEAPWPHGVSVDRELYERMVKLKKTCLSYSNDWEVALADALHCTLEFYQAMINTMNVLPRFSEPAPASYLARAGIPLEKAGYTGLEWWLYRLMAAKKKVRLKEHYERLAQPLDFRQPYVYLALHQQPEKSTCPEGGVFTHQFLVADMLSKCVPAGWRVFVKEHPFQFELRGSGELTRNGQFYDDIVSLPNVDLVPMSYTPFDLIDRAQAVATVTGTTGWEALVRGKPVLIFGNAWYKGCEGVFHVPTEAQCRNAVQTITAGYQVDPKKVRLFIQALENLSIRGYTIPELEEGAAVSHDENVRAFVEAIETSILQKRAA